MGNLGEDLSLRDSDSMICDKIVIFGDTDHLRLFCEYTVLVELINFTMPLRPEYASTSHRPQGVVVDFLKGSLSRL